MLTKGTWEELDLEMEEIKKGQISLTNRCDKGLKKILKNIRSVTQLAHI